MNKIMSIGKKIKYLRKKDKLTQVQLAGKKYSKQLISQLENNRTKLSVEVAEFITKKCNKIAAHNNVYFEFVLNKEWLLQTEENQARKIIDVNLKKNDFRNLDYLLDIASKYELDSEYIQICEKAAKYFYSKYEDDKSFKYAISGEEKCLELKNDFKRVHFLTYRIAYEIKKKEYYSALENSFLGLEILNANEIKDVKFKYRNIIHYNLALIYKNINKVNKAVQCLDKISLKYLDKNKKIDIIMQKASYQFRLNNFNKSIDIYYKLLANNFLTKDLLVICYKNISKNFLYLKKYKLALVYIKKCLKMQCYKKNNTTLSNCLIVAAKIQIEINNLKKAEQYFLRALYIKNTIEVKQQLIKLYILENTQSKIANMLDLNTIKKLNEKTLKKLVIYYCSKI